VIAKYLRVFCTAAIAAIEFFLAFRVFPRGLVSMRLFLAICSSALGLMYSCNLAHEKRSLFLSLIRHDVRCC